MTGIRIKKQKIGFYAMPVASVIQYFKSSAQGLDPDKIEKQREKHGWNEIPEAEKVSWITIFSNNLKASWSLSYL
jgi:magnesium-transporting ATPase (P-type)